MADQETYGERVFRKYIEANSLQLDFQPAWPHTVKRPDYRIPHPTGDVVLEIKDIEGNMFGEGKVGAYDPYKLVRSHIGAAQKQFSPFADFPCVLALISETYARVELGTPHIMLGAMYGNFGFEVPVDTETGMAMSSEMRQAFLAGRESKMRHLRPDGMIETRNTRISAILTIHDYSTTHGWDEPGVTVWENAYAYRRLPFDLFKGKMDRWYSVEQSQGLGFQGEGLTELIKPFRNNE